MNYREAKGLLASIKVRMQDVKQFYIHLSTYLAVNTGLMIVNILDGPDGPVAMIPLVLWGALLARHGRKVFGWKGAKTAEWEKELLRELMDGKPLPEDIELLPASSSEKDILRMRKRLENLEAIIASQNWDHLDEEKVLLKNRKAIEELSQKVD